jgi:hypothetical protein
VRYVAISEVERHCGFRGMRGMVAAAPMGRKTDRGRPHAVSRRPQPHDYAA